MSHFNSGAAPLERTHGVEGRLAGGSSPRFSLWWSLVYDQLLPTLLKEAPAGGNRAGGVGSISVQVGNLCAVPMMTGPIFTHKCGCSDRNHNQGKREKLKLKKDATNHRGITVIRD